MQVEWLDQGGSERVESIPGDPTCGVGIASRHRVADVMRLFFFAWADYNLQSLISDERYNAPVANCDRSACVGVAASIDSRVCCPWLSPFCVRSVSSGSLPRPVWHASM